MGDSKISTNMRCIKSLSVWSLHMYATLIIAWFSIYESHSDSGHKAIDYT